MSSDYVTSQCSGGHHILKSLVFILERFYHRFTGKSLILRFSFRIPTCPWFWATLTNISKKYFALPFVLSFVLFFQLAQNEEEKKDAFYWVLHWTLNSTHLIARNPVFPSYRFFILLLTKSLGAYKSKKGVVQWSGPQWSFPLLPLGVIVGNLCKICTKKRSKAGDFSLPVKRCLPFLMLLMLISFRLWIRPPLRCLLGPGALPQNWLQHVTFLHSMTLLCPKIHSRGMAAFPSKVIKIQRTCYYLYSFLSV